MSRIDELKNEIKVAQEQLKNAVKRVDDLTKELFDVAKKEKEIIFINESN